MSEPIVVDMCGLPGARALRIKLPERDAPVSLSLDLIVRGGRVMSPGYIGPGGGGGTVVLIPWEE